ncbi:MAG: hypothetical protein EP329_05710, partial [Deltaproteobacteria bacterium]
MHPPSLSRLALLTLLLGLAAPARAELPIPASEVEAALAEAARAPATAVAYARFLSALPVTDALPPADRARWLERLRDARGAPLLSARAELELLDHAPDGPEVAARAAALGFLTRWRVVGPDPTSDVVEAQRDLLAALAGSPEPGQRMPLAGQERIWAVTTEGPPGAVSAEPWVLRDAPTIVHLLTEVWCPRGETVFLRVGATGDVAVAVDGQAAGVV